MKRGFPGGGGGGMNMNMLKQAQKMQQDMLKMQQELQESKYTATSGGGVVSATVNGQHDLLALEIDREVISPEESDMLCDLIVAAVNEANRKAAEASQNEMKKLTGGINIPGLI